MTLTSVIIASDRDEISLLHETLDSVLHQTIAEQLEVILLHRKTEDNGSDWLSTIDDSRVRVVSAGNRDRVSCWNLGLREASGDTIAFITVGDRWTPDKLERQLDVLTNHPEAELAYSWVEFADETLTWKNRHQELQGNLWPYLLVWDFLETPSNPLVRKTAFNAVGEFDENLNTAAVWDMGLRLARQFPFACVPHVDVVRGDWGDRDLQQWETDRLAVLDRAFAGETESIQSLHWKSQTNLYKHLAYWAFRRPFVPKNRELASRYLRYLAESDPAFRDESEFVSAALLAANSDLDENWLAGVGKTFDRSFFLEAIARSPYPKISVVVPAYNCETTVRATLDSLFNQTFKDFEVLVVDDSSTDDTLNAVKAIEDPRLRVFSYPNAGPAATRNRGFNHILGQYVSFIDADDLWTPDKLAAQLEALDANPDAAVAYSWTDYIDESGQVLRPGSHLSVSGDVLSHLLLADFLENGSNALIRRDAFAAVEGFDESFTVAHDWDLFLRLAYRYFFVCVEKAQILYRLTAASVSSKVVRQEQFCLKVLDRAYHSAPQAFQSLRSQSLTNLYHYLTYRALQPPWTAETCQAVVGFVEKILQYDLFASEYSPLLADIAAAATAHSVLPHAIAQQLYPDTDPGFRTEDLFQYTRSRPYPAISVIIPAYNAEDTITETIDTVLQQTFTDFEIIVIDDGSSDRTVEVVKSIDDPRVKVFSYPNAGQGESRNRGACHAQGEFFAFLDADDLWTPHKLEDLYNAIVKWKLPNDPERWHENRKPAVAYSWVDWIDEDGKHLARGCDYSCNGYIYPKLLLSDFIAGGSNVLMWRGAFYQVRGFNPDFPPAEDRDMWLRLAEKFHFVAVEKPHLRYRQVPTSQSANVERMERSQLRVLEAAFRRAPTQPPFVERPDLLPDYQKQTYANSYKYLTFKALDGEPTQARGQLAARLFWTVLKNEPQLWQERWFVFKLWLRIGATALLPPAWTQRILDRFATFPKLHSDLLRYTRMEIS
ncbi:glycosyltransferase [Baaleninema simplex]|uniref:glycosyltransferase n=1 Tax=Baaleninema simplex TaxID=2862350 RepID=UPI0003644229|nr:glycosyltransferase [Baaleninema simplex]